MDYRGAIDYLDRHVNLEANAGRIEGLSLDKMRRLVSVLGDPQRAFKVVHVTGTNGKGSVARMVSSLVRAHGLTVGTYTSPHLSKVNERIAWDLEPIDDAAFAEVVSDLADLVPLAGVEPSYFELLTAAALSWFAGVAVDVAVIEVGLLGQFDATNVVDADVAVITNVGRDHTDGTGNWRERIATEKAGIIKPRSWTVLGETDPALVPIFEDREQLGLWRRGRDFDVIDDTLAVGGHQVSLRTADAVHDEVFVPLHGRHQVDNAVLSIAAVEALFGRPLADDALRDGFGDLTVPGRFEVVGHFPLVIVDGAHNPDGAAAAAETLAEEFDVGGRRILVVGLLQGRDPREMLDALDAARADLVIACTPDSPRALEADAVAVAARELGVDAEVAAGVADALDRALAIAEDTDLVLVTGSLYVIGPARDHLSAVG